jgi:hypothetical protein
MNARTCTLVVWVLCSCVKAQMQLTTEGVGAIGRDYTSAIFYLRRSMYVTPFFGDATKRLLTSVAPDEVRLLENPDGTSVNPGPIEKIVVAGTAVRVAKIEYPLGLTAFDRVLLTPRSLAWVFVELAQGSKNALPLIIVLRPGLQSEQDTRSELEKSLGHDSLDSRMAELSDSTREAIARKQTISTMTPELVEMSWGDPESKVLSFEGEKAIQRWTWPGKRRTAQFVDGLLTESTAGH